MKKINSKSIITLLLLALVTTVANGMPKSQERQMRLGIVNLFEEYEQYAGIDQNFPEYTSPFRSLFVSGESQVYNDLNNLVPGEIMTIRDYITALSEKSSTTRITIKNIRLVEIQDQGDKQVAICKFDKYVNLTSVNGVELSSDFFNESDYHLTAYVEYDASNDACLFQKIEGNVDKKITLPDDYKVVKMDRGLEENYLADGKPMTFNAMNQSFIGAKAKLTCKDPDYVVKMKEETPGSNVWTVSAKVHRVRLKFHYNLQIGDNFKLDGSNALSEKKTKTDNFGMDFGYIFPGKSKMKVGIFVGAGLANTTFNLGYTNSDYYYSTSADVDGDSYRRHYQNMSMAQTVKMTDLAFPLYFDFEQHFGRVFSMYMDLGGIAYLNMNNKVEVDNGAAYVYGIYGGEYGGIRLDEHWGYNGFGNQTYSSADLDNANIVNLKSFNASAIGRLGFRFNIPSTPVAIDLGASYEYGLINVIDGIDPAVQYGNPNSASNALVFNTINGLDSKEHVRNMTEGFSSVKRQGIKVNLGIILKL